jgi:hypothetical protein
MTTTAVPEPEPEPSSADGIAELIGQYTTLSPLGEQQLRGDSPFCRSRTFRVRAAVFADRPQPAQIAAGGTGGAVFSVHPRARRPGRPSSDHKRLSVTVSVG